MTQAENRVEQLASGLEPCVSRLLSETESQLEQHIHWMASRTELLLSNADTQLERFIKQIQLDSERWLTVSYADIEHHYQSIFQLGHQQINQAMLQTESLGREILGIGSQATLHRGFAIVRNQNNSPIVSARQAQPNRF